MTDHKPGAFPFDGTRWQAPREDFDGLALHAFAGGRREHALQESKRLLADLRLPETTNIGSRRIVDDSHDPYGACVTPRHHLQ
jgi:hypothetical protein